MMRPANDENGLATKKPSAARDKANRDYKGDISRVVDLIGGTCVMPADSDFLDAEKAIRKLLAEPAFKGCSIAKVKKLGFHTMEPQYRDVKISVRFANGGIGEIILVEDAMNDAKFNRGGHLVYEVMRELFPLIWSNKKAHDAYHALEELSRMVYQAGTLVDAESFARSKSRASSALEGLASDQKSRLSDDVAGMVKSSASCLKKVKPASVISAALPSRSLITNISGDILRDNDGEVNNNFSANMLRESRAGQVTFNVVGPNAKNWDKIKHRAFKGRDDGKERAEIDASQAKLTPRAFLGDAGDEYRLLVAGKAMPFGVQDDLEKLREQQKLIDGWYHILFETDDVDKAQEYSHEHGMTQEWWSVNTALLKNVKEFVTRQLQLAGVTGEGKYGNLLQSNGKLMGLVMESLISGKVNEDVAAELDKMSGGYMKCLKDVLDYEELYEAYPDLKWLPVGVADLGYELRGRLFVKGGYPDSIELNVRLDADGRRSTLLHEIQHAIQNIEEFAKGGTAEKAGKVLEKQVRQYRIRLEHLRHEQRWLYAVDTAKDHLQRMLRLLKRPRAILKMGERFPGEKKSRASGRMRGEGVRCRGSRKISY